MSAAVDWLNCNRQCDCWSIERGRIADALPPLVRNTLDERHAHLFADTGVCLHQDDLHAMAEQIKAIETVALREDYQAAALADVTFDGPAQQRGTRGVLMGFDFHLSVDGPKLIEINTNAGGAFLALHMEKTLSLSNAIAESPRDDTHAFLDMFTREWQLSGRPGQPTSIAIVDDEPQSQYLYSDMQLAAELLRQRFSQVEVVSRGELYMQSTQELRLRSTGEPIDMVYNRLTDFALTEPLSSSLYEAWQSDAAVVTPSPRHHRLLANKLNLVSLTDAARWKTPQVFGNSARVYFLSPRRASVGARLIAVQSYRAKPGPNCSVGSTPNPILRKSLCRLPNVWCKQPKKIRIVKIRIVARGCSSLMCACTAMRRSLCCLPQGCIRDKPPTFEPRAAVLRR